MEKRRKLLNGTPYHHHHQKGSATLKNALGIQISSNTSCLGFRQIKSFPNWLQVCKSKNLINDYGAFSEEKIVAPPRIPKLNSNWVRGFQYGKETEETEEQESSSKKRSAAELEEDIDSWNPWSLTQEDLLDFNSDEDEKEKDEEGHQTRQSGDFTPYEIKYNRNLNLSKARAYKSCSLKLSQKDIKENREYIQWFRKTVETRDPLYLFTTPVVPSGFGEYTVEDEYKTYIELKIPPKYSGKSDGVNGPVGLMKMIRAGIVNNMEKISQKAPFMWIIHEGIRLSSPQLGTFCKNETSAIDSKWNALRMEIDFFCFSGKGLAISWNFKGGKTGSTSMEIAENEWTWLDWDTLVKECKLDDSQWMTSKKIFEMYPWSTRLNYVKRVSGINAPTDNKKSFVNDGGGDVKMIKVPIGCDTSPFSPGCVPPHDIRYRILDAYLHLINKGYNVKEGSKIHTAMSIYITETFLWVLRVCSIRDSGKEMQSILQKRPELCLGLQPKYAYMMTQIGLALDKELSMGIAPQALIRMQKLLVLRSEIRIFGVINYWLEVRDPQTFNPQDLIPLLMEMRIAWWYVPKFYDLNKERHIGIALICSELRRPMPFRMSGAVTKESISQFRSTINGKMLVRLTRCMVSIQMFYLLLDACRWPQIISSVRNPRILDWREISKVDTAVFWLLRVFSVMDGECEALSFCAFLCNVHESDMDLCFFLKEKYGRDVQSWTYRMSRMIANHQIGFVATASGSNSIRKRNVRSTIMNGVFVKEDKSVFIE